MREFEEVGSTVSDLASDDATVVMGTVIDPDMGDDLRVTVVATGLGEAIRHQEVEKPMTLVRDGTTGQPVNASGSDEETVEESMEPEENPDLFKRQHDIDYLDIPSFLRKQAD